MSSRNVKRRIEEHQRQCALESATTNVIDFKAQGIKLDKVSESTSAAGVTIDGVVCKDSAVTASLTGNVTGNVTGENLLTVGAITAGTTQTQAGATPITTQIALVTTGNANDGVKLPAASAGLTRRVVNLSANALKVYPNTDDKVNGGSANAAYTHAASKSAIYWCKDSTDWYLILGA